MNILPNEDLFLGLRKKAAFKQEVYVSILETFRLIKTNLAEMAESYRQKYKNDPLQVPFEYHDKGEFDAELRFGGDILIFTMHTNIFEFSRDHEVMKTSYIHEKAERSYCGVIMIFNFLADSFKYNRMNDLGYMIGRIFVNSEKHYFIEGKREIGQLYNNFESSVISSDSIRTILDSAVRYTLNFDLLTPPYDSMKMLTVADIQSTLDSMKMTTGKRLGFRFQGDQDEIR